jgi:hypothetical protein
MYQTVAVLIPLAGILFGSLFPIAIVWLVLRFRAQRNQLVYDTAVKLADKGQSVPPQLFENLNPPGSDLRRGVVLVMFGLALCIGLYEVGAPWTFGLIPLFMGVGFLIVWQIEGRASQKS